MQTQELPQLEALRAAKHPELEPRIRDVRPVQTLWAGYGHIVRVRFWAGPPWIVKIIRFPTPLPHEGDAERRSRERKRASYEVEGAFYQTYTSESRGPERHGSAQWPQLIARLGQQEGLRLVLEDVDERGYCERRSRLNPEELDACLAWLAAFHARFLGQTPGPLWAEGGYWHLGTRPDEFRRMPAGRLKASASELDRRLRDAKFRTLIHGDAKAENFCFLGPKSPITESPTTERPRPAASRVMAVDFQYVGGGVGVKDVAYLLAGLGEPTKGGPLDSYFRYLQQELAASKRDTSFAELEEEWRELYPVAVDDFARFLAGWLEP